MSNVLLHHRQWLALNKFQSSGFEWSLIIHETSFSSGQTLSKYDLLPYLSYYDYYTIIITCNWMSFQTITVYHWWSDSDQINIPYSVVKLLPKSIREEGTFSCVILWFCQSSCLTSPLNQVKIGCVSAHDQMIHGVLLMLWPNQKDENTPAA